MANISKQQLAEMVEIGKRNNVDPRDIVVEAINKGHNIEGVDGQKILQEIDTSQQQQAGTEKVRGNFMAETRQDIKETWQGVKGAFKSAVDRVRGAQEKTAEVDEETGEFKQSVGSGLFQTFGEAARGASDILGETIIGIGKTVLPERAEQRIERGVQTVAGEAMDTEVFQKAQQGWQQFKEQNPEAAANINAALGIAEVGAEFIGLGAASKGSKQAVGAGRRAVGSVARTADDITTSASKVTKAIKDTGSDVLSEFSPQQLSERNFAKAFKLSAGDVADLDAMVGGPVSEWAIANNLIKGTGEETVEQMVRFKLDNYNAVRDAVGAVDETFSFRDVPEVENIVDNLIQKTEGFQSQRYSQLNNQLKDVAERLNRGEASLSDVQFVKSAFDDIESIFKRSSSGGTEFKEGLRFKDLGESRSQVQNFIESRVSEKLPNVDIGELNRNVRVARGIVDDIANRAGKFDTQSSASLGDYFVFGLGQQVGPGVGPAVFAVKKVVESQPFRLRLAEALSTGKRKIPATQLDEVQQAITDAIESQIDISL